MGQDFGTKFLCQGVSRQNCGQMNIGRAFAGNNIDISNRETATRYFMVTWPSRLQKTKWK